MGCLRIHRSQAKVWARDSMNTICLQIYAFSKGLLKSTDRLSFVDGISSVLLSSGTSIEIDLNPHFSASNNSYQQ